MRPTALGIPQGDVGGDLEPESNGLLGGVNRTLLRQALGLFEKPAPSLVVRGWVHCRSRDLAVRPLQELLRCRRGGELQEVLR
ncbi:hypothetical protein ACRAWF_46515 [Streptomyces sp. L7]